MLEVRQLGGALSRPPANPNPIGHRDSRFLVSAIGATPSPEMAELVEAHLVRVADEMRYGRALISIREDELAAEAMGVNTTRYKVLAFVISSAFAGIAGALFGHFRQFLHTNDFQFIRSVEILIMIVLGGMGSIAGAVLGAIVITILPELLRKLPGDLYSYRLVIYSALLILIMLTRPQGIMGAKKLRNFMVKETSTTSRRR